MTDEELVTLVQQQLSESEGGHSDTLDGERQAALDYYYGRDTINPPRSGGSGAHSMDVSDMVNSNLAMLSQMFNTDQAVVFEANGQEDEEQAEAESNAVNHYVMERCGGYVNLMMTGAKDALLQRNGFSLIEVEDHITTTIVELEGITDEGMAIYLGDSSPIDEREHLGGNRVKHTRTRRRFKLRPIQPERCMWWRNWHDMDLQEIPFFAILEYESKSKLIAMGLDRTMVEELQPTTTVGKYAEHSRNQNLNPNLYAWTKDQERVAVYKCWMLFDDDDDGIAERWEVWCAGNEESVTKLLKKERVTRVPVATGTPFIQPHRLNGESIFDRLKSIQDSKTACLRMWHDNHFRAVHSRVGAVENAVNMNDLLDGRPGGAVRIQSPDALVPLPFTDIGPSCEVMMNYLDKQRTERGGASLEMQTSQGQIMGETYAGIERQYTAKELLVQMVAKNLAETLIRHTFLNMHYMLRAYSLEPINFKHNGQWVQTDPRTWPERDQINIKVGLTPGQRNAANMALHQLITMQAQGAAPDSPFAGVLVDANTMHKTIVTWLEGNSIDNPSALLVDPNSDQAQQASGNKAQAAQEAKTKAERDEAFQKFLEKYKIDEETKVKMFEIVVDAEVEEAKIVGHATTELQKLGISGEQAAEQSDRDSAESALDRESDESIGDRAA